MLNPILDVVLPTRELHVLLPPLPEDAQGPAIQLAPEYTMTSPGDEPQSRSMVVSWFPFGIFPGRAPQESPVVRAVQALSMIHAHALWVPENLVTGPAGEAARRLMIERFRVSWVIWLGAVGAKALGASQLFSTVLIVLAPVSATTLTRLVDLRASPLSAGLAAVRSCARQQGGSHGSTTVLRGTTLGVKPWRYYDYSGEKEYVESDAEALGALIPLGDLATIRRGPVHVHQDSSALGRLTEHQADPPVGALRLYSGGDIQPGGQLAAPTRFVWSDKVRRDISIADGAIIVRSILSRRVRKGFSFAALLPSDGHGATANQSILIVEWDSGVAVEVRVLLLAFLNSVNVAKQLAAGTGIHLAVEELRQLRVPRPTSDVIEAARAVAFARAKFDAWAADAAASWNDFVNADEFRTEVPRLLANARRHALRVEAGVESASFGYQITNFFPHAIAVRYQKVVQLPDGKKKTEETLRTAEYACRLVAFMALASDLQGRVPSIVGNWWKGTRLTIDFGKTIEILRIASSEAAKAADPSALALPETATLESALRERNSPLTLALSALSLDRNDRAHLVQTPESQEVEFSGVAEAHLKTLLDALKFITSAQLIAVDDVDFDPTQELHQLTGDLIVGVSPAFRRRTLHSPQPASKGVGFIDHRGRFTSLSPWVIRSECEHCKHWETFILSSHEKGATTFVAMETGHKVKVTSDVHSRWVAFLNKVSVAARGPGAS